MKVRRHILAFILAFCLLLSLPCHTAASGTDDILRQLLQYYQHHQDNAETDILRLLEQLETIDQEQAENWRAIMSAWSSACNDLVINPNILPDGLPEDDSLCIVVMGFALNYNGSMSAELQGRISVALASAEKYPNAYILCAGGGTAGGNYSVTEAGQMAAWLQGKGIAPERIIVENRSYSTEQNVRYGLEILRKSYPQIKSLAVISSDYHIRRCHWLFEAEIILQGLENEYQVVSNAAYEAGYIGESGYWSEAESLSNLLTLNFCQTAPPKLSQLTEIAVTGANACYVDEIPNLTVTAYYDSGFSRDVTQKVEILGFDSSVAGEVLAEIIYTENSITKSANFAVTILELPTEPPTEPAIVIQPDTSHPVVSVPITDISTPAEIDSSILWITGAVIAFVIVIFAILRMKKRGKYQK